MLIKVTNLFGSFVVRVTDWPLHGGYRGIVVESNLSGWPVGSMSEGGTLITYERIEN
jgi:hypothetical protein